MRISKTKSLLFASFAVLALATFSCGKDGDSDDDDDDPDPGEPGSVGDNGLTDVLFKVQISEEGSTEPSDNFGPNGTEIWVLNHSEQSFEAKVVDGSGEFIMPVTSFVAGNVYSISVVDSTREYLGDIDFASSQTGIQSAFTYSAGLGFDGGTLTITVDSGGRSISTQSFETTLGGGFSLHSTAETGINDFTPPLDGLSIAFGSDLVVTNPGDLLNRFYRLNTDSTSYSESLRDWSALNVLIDDSEGVLSGAFVDSVGDWIGGARYLDGYEKYPSSGSNWEATGSIVPRIGETSEYHARVFMNAFPRFREALTVQLIPSEGESFKIPLAEDLAFGFPPMIVSASMDGGTASSIDYTDSTIDNGLSRPFCIQSSDATFNMMPPLDLNGEAIDWEEISHARLALEYYNSADVKLTVAASELPEAWRADGTSTVPPSITRNWVFEELSFNYVLGATAGAASTHAFTIPSDLLLTTAGGETVSEIRVLFWYAHEEKPRRSGLAFWLKFCE